MQSAPLYLGKVLALNTGWIIDINGNKLSVHCIQIYPGSEQ
ncbi:MAG: hypothetical protein ANABAC_2281 [Anaerolineae bacterium]|nr:MAG: hypothetical protein ANABAC_2281 [Anaerolineae bacterium]